MLGLRTELAVAGGKDKGDPNPLTVRPPPALEAAMEADKPGGLFSSGHDAVNRFTVSHPGVEQHD